MAEEVWLSVCYTGDFIHSNGGLSWVFDDGIESGKVIPFRIPRKTTYLELYKKLIDKLKLDSSVYEMVLRCLNPTENKDPLYSIPYSISDDDSVDWLISYGDKTRLCVTLKLKTNNNSVVGSGEVNGMNRDFGVMSEVMVIEDGVDRSLEMDILMQSDGADEAGNLGDRVDDIEPTEVLNSSVGNVSQMQGVKIEEIHNEVAKEDEMCGGEPLLQSLGEDAWLANESSQDQILMVHESQSLPWYVPKEEDVKVNDIFDTKVQLKEKLQLLGLKHRFEFKTNRSDNTRYLVTCKAEACMWRLVASNLGASKMFEVRKYERCHSCPRSLSNRYHKHAASKLIGKVFAPSFQDPSHVCKPKDVMSEFSREYGYELKYSTAYNAKKHGKKLVRGNSADSYKEKRVENKSREVVMNRRWIQAVSQKADSSEVSRAISENELNHTQDDSKVDMSEGMKIDMFSTPSSSEEIVELSVKDYFFKIKLLSNEYQHTCTSTGLMLWESARLMASILAVNQEIVAGKRVLELGTGCGGICSMIAARSASLVVATDGDEKALDLLRENIAMNLKLPFLSSLTVKKLEWGDENDIEAIKQVSEKGFDVIIGTDVTYASEAVMPLFATAKELISKGGFIEGNGLILCHVLRRVDEPSILSAAAEFGFRLMERWPEREPDFSSGGVVKKWFSGECRNEVPSTALNIMYFRFG